MSHTTVNTSQLRRANLWSQDLKAILLDELQAQPYVRWLTDFPDGDTFNIPSIGQLPVRNYPENSQIIYDQIDTGNFTFSITEYVSSATYITNKAKQDAFYADQLMAAFVPSQARALLEKLETDIFALGAAGASGGQTGGSLNQINGAAHRFVGSGTNEAIAVADFARALYSLKKANVSDQNLVAFVDPSVEYTLNTLTNLTNVSNNPMWEGVITSGLASGRRFVKNIYGFDVYVTNYLATGQNEQPGGSGPTTGAGVANIFFSAGDPMSMPFVGAWRQMPTVETEYKKDFQREEYVTTARYGLKVFRPENLVVVLTDTDIVS